MGGRFNTDLHALYYIDAPSFAMASPTHYDLSDYVIGHLIKQGIHACWALNNIMPIACPYEDISEAGWGNLFAGMCAIHPRKKGIQLKQG